METKMKNKMRHQNDNFSIKLNSIHFNLFV